MFYDIVLMYCCCGKDSKKTFVLIMYRQQIVFLIKSYSSTIECFELYVDVAINFVSNDNRNHNFY